MFTIFVKNMDILLGRHPSRHAIGNAWAARGMPAAQIASVIGLARLQTYASSNCVSASKPVLAVSAGGKSSVSSGSTNATRANK